MLTDYSRCSKQDLTLRTLRRPGLQGAGLEAVAQVSSGAVLVRLAEALGVCFGVCVRGHLGLAAVATSPGFSSWSRRSPPYMAAVSVGVAVAHVEMTQLWLFGLVLACSAVSVELTRRAGEPGGVVRDVYAIWDLPAAVLLPPVYVMLVPIPRMLLTQARIRQTVLHRRVYTAAAVGLAYGAASVAFQTTPPLVGTGTGAGLWILLVARVRRAPAHAERRPGGGGGQGMAPQTRVLSEITRAEAVFGNTAELALGTLVTLAAVHASVALVLALPLVISLQRSLRHSQLLAEASVDAKTGLLNDRTWRRRAADEVEQAVREGVPVAVGILDIDHFKAVNDTYGHPPGTRSSRPWPRPSWPSCAAMTSSAGSAARSSRSSCRVPRRRRRSRWPSGAQDDPADPVRFEGARRRPRRHRVHRDRRLRPASPGSRPVLQHRRPGAVRRQGERAGRGLGRPADRAIRSPGPALCTRSPDRPSPALLAYAGS